MKIDLVLTFFNARQSTSLKANLIMLSLNMTKSKNGSLSN